MAKVTEKNTAKTAPKTAASERKASAKTAAGSADRMPEGYAPTAIDGLSVRVEPSAEERCARCWTRSATVGSDSEHPELCARCAAVIRG